MEKINEELKTKVMEVEYEDTKVVFRNKLIVLVVFIIASIALILSDNDVRKVFISVDPRLMIIMIVPFSWAIYMLVYGYIEVQDDNTIVEELDSDQGRINISKAELPLDIANKKSFLIKNFALLSTRKNISDDKKEALKSEYFKTNRNLTMFAIILSRLGFAGTIIGFMKVLVLINDGAEPGAGMAYAFGTTLLAIFASLVVEPINHSFQNAKEKIFYNYLDILLREEKDEN